jgi:hypothetical protein
MKPVFLLGCTNVFSTELGIRLSFIKTSEFRGVLNTTKSAPSVRHCFEDSSRCLQKFFPYLEFKELKWKFFIIEMGERDSVVDRTSVLHTTRRCAS